MTAPAEHGIPASAPSVLRAADRRGILTADYTIKEYAMKNTYKLLSLTLCTLWLAASLFLWFGPRTQVSESERRLLAQMPKLTVKNLSSGKFMSDMESFSQDQFPLREGLRTAQALFQRYGLGMTDSNGITFIDSQAVKLEYPLNEQALAKNLAILAKAAEYFPESRRVFACVPDKAYYYIDSGIPTMDYDALFAAVKAAGRWECTDLTAALNAQSYYATDLHWRQEAIAPAANVIAQALELPELPEYKEIDRGAFNGVYVGQSALPMAPDRLITLENEFTQAAFSTGYGSDKTAAVYDLDKLSSRDRYDVFLSGPAGFMTVTNPLSASGRNLVVFRDSFGSSLVPLLLYAYDTVTLVDLRYFPSAQLDKVLKSENQDVLFLYSSTVLNTPGILK